MLKVGLVGCGVIGTEIAKAIDKMIPGLELVAICDKNKAKEDALLHFLEKIPILATIDGIIERADLVVEAASADIVGELTKKAINKKKDIMIMSIGGMIDHFNLFDEARERGCRIYFPSGAIAGLDGIKAAAEAHIDSVTLDTYKSPSGLEGAPYLEEKKIDLRKIKRKTTIFEGSSREAVKAFPKNINVAAVLSFAGIGIDKTRVRIIADPSLKRNIHHIVVKGNFGRLETRVENVPSPFNPRTSYLAALSAIATLRRIADRVQIGT